MQAHPCSVVFIALTLGSAVAGTSANYTTSPQAIDPAALLQMFLKQQPAK